MVFPSAQTLVVDWRMLALVSERLGVRSQTAETTASEQAPGSAANADVYAALNTMFTGDGGPMKDARSRAEDITYMGPNGPYLM
jgi:hypothetical protein